MKQQEQQRAPTAADDDKLFVANFIVADYLGPDVVSADKPPKISTAQRLTQRFAPYTPNHLGQSSLTVTQILTLYYYILRNSTNPSLIFNPTQFYFYLKGKLISPCPSAANFTTFFPLHIHKHKLSSIKGIVVIDDPGAGWIDCEELDRFKRLTGLVDLRVDRESWLSCNWTFDDHDRRLISGLINENNKLTTMTTVIVHGKPVAFELFMLSWELVLIGISSAAYLFRVALPPLPDNYCGLSCEVSWEGKVEINHSGGLIFTTSFNLPGPVDPRLFSGNIKSDGIFEAVIVKQNTRKFRMI
ncbi:Increased DNA methylation 3 [Linum grandiflorum]